MLNFGLKGVLGHTSPLENFRIDQLIIGLYLAPKALGLYVVAQAFVNLPRFVATNAGMIAFPALSAMRDKSSAKRTVTRFFIAVVSLNIIIAIPLMIFMAALIKIFFGDNFAPAASIARILLVGAILYSARRILVEGLRGLGRHQLRHMQNSQCIQRLPS